jgi:hypothetical protein
MTEPLFAKISDEDFQTILNALKEKLTGPLSFNNPLSRVQQTRTLYSKTKEKNVVECLISFDGEEPAWVPVETINGMYAYVNKTLENLNI